MKKKNPVSMSEILLVSALKKEEQQGIQLRNIFAIQTSKNRMVELDVKSIINLVFEMGFQARITGKATAFEVHLNKDLPDVWSIVCKIKPEFSFFDYGNKFSYLVIVMVAGSEIETLAKLFCDAFGRGFNSLPLGDA